MGESLPKAVKVWMAANILAIEFDNGQTRYLRSHNIKDYISAWSLKKGKGKRVNLILPPTWQWLGSMPTSKRMVPSFYLKRIAIRHKNFGITVRNVST